MYKILVLLGSLACAAPAVAQTLDAVVNRIFEAPGRMEWIHDMQVIAALAGMQQEDADYGRMMRELDFDFSDWSKTHAEAFLEYGVRTSASGAQYQERYMRNDPDDPLVQRFMKDGVCAFPDGSVAQDVIDWGHIYLLCHNNPGWHEYQKGEVLKALPRLGAVNQDNIGVPWKINNGFCEGCERAFRTYMKNLRTLEEIRAMGIRDIDRFSMKEYLKKRHKGKLGNHLVDDPVARAWIMMQGLAQRDLWKDIYDAIHRDSAQYGRAIPVSGNQWGWIEWEKPYNMLLSDVNDIISIEADPDYRAYEHPRPVIGSTKYKQALAAGRGKKPVWVRGGNFERRRTAPDGTVYRQRLFGEVFQDLVHAEAFANGGVRVFNLAGEGAPPPEPPYEHREHFFQRYVDYAQMIHNHRAAFQDRINAAEVAVAYSVPTQYCEFFPPLGIFKSPSFGRYMGFARLLEECHVPYDVVILGHPDLFPDLELKEQLARYRVLILPGVFCMTESQATAVRQFVENGGSVVWSGELATHDENRMPRTESLLQDFPRIQRSRVGRGRIIGITNEDLTYRQGTRTDEPLSPIDYMQQKRERAFGGIASQAGGRLTAGYGGVPNATDFHAMREAVMWALDGNPQVVSKARPETQFNLWLAENRRSAGLHMVNYHVDLMRDYVEPQRDVSVTVRLPDALEPIDRVTLVAPGEPDQDVMYSRSGETVTFIIPKLRVWMVAVFTAGLEHEAATAIAGARKQIRKQSVMKRDTGVLVDRYTAAFQLYTSRRYAAALKEATELTQDVSISRE